MGMTDEEKVEFAEKDVKDILDDDFSVAFNQMISPERYSVEYYVHPMPFVYRKQCDIF